MSHYTCEVCWNHYQSCTCPRRPRKPPTKEKIRQDKLLSIQYQLEKVLAQLKKLQEEEK